MAETINIAGKKFPKQYVLIGGAVAVGIVGYAYYTKSAGGGVEEEVGLVDEFGDERITPTTIDTYDVKVDNNNATFKTESEWYTAAVDLLLLNYGVADTPTAANAINDYLANRPLSPVEVPMMQFVINTLGPPPTGARTIRYETSTPTTPAQNTRAKPGKVTGLKVIGANNTDITFGWNKVPTAGTYRINLIKGPNEVIHETRTTALTWRVRSSYQHALVAGKPYRIEIWAVSNQNVAGDKASITGRTKG